MNKKVKAALLNAFVLPGLGQLMLGRKIRGFVCIMLVNLIILAALFIVLKALSPAIATQIAGGAPLSVAQISDSIGSSRFFGQGILVAFVTVWFFALVDIFKGNDEPSQQE